jgi:hypothetical protein
LLLLPTIKGISYACTFLDLNITDLTISNKDEITSYIELVREAFPTSEHKEMLAPLFSTVLHGDLETEGENATNKKELIRYSFQKGMLGLLQKNNYKTQNFFNFKVTEWLKHMFSSVERKEIKDDFNRIRNNFTAAIQQFPD